MSKVLVISYNTFTWFYELKDVIKNSNDRFEVIIVCDDVDIPLWFEKKYDIKLCNEARYVQRKHDLMQVGKKLKIKKLQNLRYRDGCIDIEKLTISIQLLILMNKYSKVIYQSNKILESIIPAICKSLKIKCESF